VREFAPFNIGPGLGNDNLTPELLKRFFQEGRSAAKLPRHTNLCQVFDVGQVEQTPYLAMAYIEGRPLSDRVGPGKTRAQRKAAWIVERPARAMQAAHTERVFHRDLKPATW
jgi:serine/threonine-protein kinase